MMTINSYCWTDLISLTSADRKTFPQKKTYQVHRGNASSGAMSIIPESKLAGAQHSPRNRWNVFESAHNPNVQSPFIRNKRRERKDIERRIEEKKITSKRMTWTIMTRIHIKIQKNWAHSQWWAAVWANECSELALNNTSSILDSSNFWISTNSLTPRTVVLLTCSWWFWYSISAFRTNPSRLWYTCLTKPYWYKVSK